MIEIKSVSKKYDDVKAVNELSINIKKGNFFGLLGPNGAGKTTLIKMIIGLLDVTDGEILIEGRNLTRDTLDIKRKIGVVSQHVNLDKEISVYENMYFSGLLYKLEKKVIKQRISEILRFLNLDKVKDRECKKLSGGMKRKLMIGRALIHNPDYIFLDEPTVGIDLNSRKEIWDFLKLMKSKGKTIILTTHYIEEAESLCDRVALMDEGMIFYDDTPENLTKALGIFTVEYFAEDRKTMYSYFNTLEEAKKFSYNLVGNYTLRDTTLEDVFYSFANKKVNKWK
ncbi:ATP-binding cassette domain-containing protein [Clostridium sediminicola]|uniref:ABC transporter ATP-binding protein n=1 Tax=Clostridium sediminicola TaxID=3114879 RepID=UPI0031F26319